MSRKTLGVLGGMGPAATALFLARIVACTQAATDQEHVDVLTLNHSSLPDRTQALQLGRTSRNALGRLLCRDALKLELMGANLLAIPCNTAHSWLDQVRAAVDIEVLSMVDIAAQELAHVRGTSRAGILATRGTLATKTYHRALAAMGIEAVECSEATQRGIDAAIYQGVKRGAANDEAAHALQAAVRELVERGCETVVLACTELSVLNWMGGPWEQDAQQHVVDALDLLVRECVVQTGAHFKPFTPT